MSLPDSTDQPRGVLVRQPRTSIYTVLLFIALLALVFSCLLMVLELWRYDFQINPPANLASSLQPTSDLAHSLMPRTYG